jgi:hypothetical protein
MLQQFIILSAMSVGLWLAARWLARINSRMRRVPVVAGRKPTMQRARLQLDPKTGRYYPVEG